MLAWGDADASAGADADEGIDEGASCVWMVIVPDLIKF